MNFIINLINKTHNNVREKNTHLRIFIILKVLNNYAYAGSP